MTMSTDDKLTETLERIADRAATPTDGRLRVARRLQTRRTRRRVAMAAVAAVAFTGLIVGANTAMGPDRRAVSTASDGQDSAGTHTPDVPTTAQTADPDSVPRLTLDVAGFRLVDADIGRTEFTAEQLASPLQYSYFQSFRPEAADWQKPGVFVFTVPPASPFGIGEDSPPETTTIVDINGNTGYLMSYGGTGASALGWRLPDGTAAFVHAPGLEPDALVALARSMTLRPDGHGWNVADLPSGLQPIIDEPNGHNADIANHSLTFEGTAGRVELHSSTGRRMELETRVADLLDDAEVSNLDVRGFSAAVVRSAHSTRVLWYDGTAGTVNYLIIEGDIETAVDRVVAGITELSEPDWNDLLAGVHTTYWTGDTPSSTSTSTP